MAVLCALYGILLAALYRSGPAPPEIADGYLIALLLFILYLGISEFCLLMAVGWVMELVAPEKLNGPLLAGLKGTLWSLVFLLLSVSAVKFRILQSSLKITDAEFLVHNLPQLWAEGTRLERMAGVGFLAGGLVLMIGFAWFFIRFQHRSRASLRFRTFVFLALVSYGGLAVVHRSAFFIKSLAAVHVPEEVVLNRFLISHPILDAPMDPEDIPVEQAMGSPLIPCGPGPAGTGMHVVWIMLEAATWEHTGFFKGDDSVTPHLNALARASLVFRNPYAASPASNYSQMALLSSLYPRRYDALDTYTRLDYPRTLIWDVLRPQGYRTAAFSCQNEAWGNMIAYLRTPGLEMFRHSPSWPDAPRRGHSDESKVFEETAVTQWIRWHRPVAQSPTFTYLNFQATHFPYEIPPGCPPLFTPVDLPAQVSFLGYPREAIPILRNRFRNALHYADAWIGNVAAYLQEAGLWDRTILVVASDHGEAFYEHRFPTHGSSLYEELVKSILLVRLPGEIPRIIEEPVSHLDVVPSLIRRLGLPPCGNFQGCGEIFDPGYRGRKRPIFFTLQGFAMLDGMIQDGWKYSTNFDSGEEELYRLDVDPRETRNLASQEAARTKDMRSRLLDLIRRQLAYYQGRLWERGRYIRPLP